MTSHRYRVTTPGVVHQVIDGEVVLVDLRSGFYYSMVGAAAEVWALLDGGASVDEIVQDLSGRHDDPDGILASEVARLVAELESDGVIEVGEGVAASLPAFDPTAEKRPFEPLTLHKYTDMRELILLDPIHEVDEGGWPNPREAA